MNGDLILKRIIFNPLVKFFILIKLIVHLSHLPSHYFYLYYQHNLLDLFSIVILVLKIRDTYTYNVRKRIFIDTKCYY
jgi:hypothetical protein